MHKKATPHLRTRAAHSTETAEDYVEAIAEILETQEICRVVDLAKFFSVSNVTVHKIIERLVSEEMVETQPYKPITLTKKGELLAKQCKHRHEIVYKFLVSIGVDETTAAIDAEGMEHHVSPITLKKFEAIIKLRK